MNIQSHILQTAQTFGLTPQDLTGPSKAQKHVRPRKLVWLNLVCAPIAFNPDGSAVYRSLPQIARWFDDRDHTTVLYGVRTLAAELYGTPAKATLAQIREAVNNARMVREAA